MHSKVWVGIVMIGVLGVVLLGFLTKFAIDSNSGLRDVIRFKTAFARDFEGAGFEEVSLRKRPGGSGYLLVLTCERSQSQGDPALFDERIAEYFVENFADRGASVLEVSYVAPRAFGCSAAEPFRKQEIALSPVRTHVQMKDQRRRLEEALEQSFGCRLLRDGFKGRNLLVEVEAPASATGDLRALAGEIEPKVREQFSVQPYVELHLRVRPARGSEASAPSTVGPVEVRYDRKGRVLGG